MSEEFLPAITVLWHVEPSSLVLTQAYVQITSGNVGGDEETSRQLSCDEPQPSSLSTYKHRGTSDSSVRYTTTLTSTSSKSINDTKPRGRLLNIRE